MDIQRIYSNEEHFKELFKASWAEFISHNDLTNINSFKDAWLYANTDGYYRSLVIFTKDANVNTSFYTFKDEVIRMESKLRDFDWRYYLQENPSIQNILTELDAMKHWYYYGKAQKLVFKNKYTNESHSNTSDDLAILQLAEQRRLTGTRIAESDQLRMLEEEQKNYLHDIRVADSNRLRILEEQQKNVLIDSKIKEQIELESLKLIQQNEIQQKTSTSILDALKLQEQRNREKSKQAYNKFIFNQQAEESIRNQVVIKENDSVRIQSDLDKYSDNIKRQIDSIIQQSTKYSEPLRKQARDVLVEQNEQLKKIQIETEHKLYILNEQNEHVQSTKSELKQVMTDSIENIKTSILDSIENITLDNMLESEKMIKELQETANKYVKY